LGPTRTASAKLWAANVPGGRATLATLGKDGDAIELPPSSPSIHVHSSPPCTDLSPARNGSVHSAAAADVEGGVRMLRWALEVGHFLVKRTHDTAQSRSVLLSRPRSITPPSVSATPSGGTTFHVMCAIICRETMP